ncbi:MAG: hypothetical protein KME26_12365 [Oscillatoria princeps RMCB-10]|nr:hypothetical protein [Oscillatoria princeps RMCB-10]
MTADGQKIISGGEDGTVLVWPSSWEGWLQVCSDRLRYHPVFQAPQSDEQNQACETCRKHVWERGTLAWGIGHGA